MSSTGTALKLIGLYMLASVLADIVFQTGLSEFAAQLLTRAIRAFGEFLWRTISGELGMSALELGGLV